MKNAHHSLVARHGYSDIVRCYSQLALVAPLNSVHDSSYPWGAALHKTSDKYLWNWILTFLMLWECKGIDTFWLTGRIRVNQKCPRSFDEKWTLKRYLSLPLLCCVPIAGYGQCIEGTHAWMNGFTTVPQYQWSSGKTKTSYEWICHF